MDKIRIFVRRPSFERGRRGALDEEQDFSDTLEDLKQPLEVEPRIRELCYRSASHVALPSTKGSKDASRASFATAGVSVDCTVVYVCCFLC